MHLRYLTIGLVRHVQAPRRRRARTRDSDGDSDGSADSAAAEDRLRRHRDPTPQPEGSVHGRGESSEEERAGATPRPDAREDDRSAGSREVSMTRPARASLSPQGSGLPMATDSPPHATAAENVGVPADMDVPTLLPEPVVDEIVGTVSDRSRGEAATDPDEDTESPAVSEQERRRQLRTDISETVIGLLNPYRQVGHLSSKVR